MSTFQFKTYRVEYVASIFWVDQYGLPMDNYPNIWEQIYPTYTEAVDALATKATFNVNLSRWQTDTDYQQGNVRRRETLVG